MTKPQQKSKASVAAADSHGSASSGGGSGGHGHSHSGSSGSCNHNHGPAVAAEPEPASEDDDHNFDARLSRRFAPPSRIPFYIVLCIIVGYLAAYYWLRLTDPRDWVRTELLDRFTLPAIAALTVGLFVTLYRVSAEDPGSVTRRHGVWGTGTSTFPSKKSSKDVDSLLPLSPPVPVAAFALQRAWERRPDLSRRYCARTRVFKPDRAHLCHVTGRTVRRLDHHCIFVYATVGAANHKYFLLFLLYTTLLASLTVFDLVLRAGFLGGLASPAATARAEALGSAATGGAVAGLGSSPRMLATLLIFVVGAAVGLALGGFLAFHLYLVAQGVTTLEFGERLGTVAPGSSVVYLAPYGQSPAPAGRAAVAALAARDPAAAAGLLSPRSPASPHSKSPASLLSVRSPVGGIGAAAATASSAGAGAAAGSGAVTAVAARASVSLVEALASGAPLMLSRFEEVMGPRELWWQWFVPTAPALAQPLGAAGLHSEEAGDGQDDWARCSWHPGVAAGQFPPRHTHSNTNKSSNADDSDNGEDDEDGEDGEDDDVVDEYGDRERRREAERRGWGAEAIMQSDSENENSDNEETEEAEAQAQLG